VKIVFNPRQFSEVSREKKKFRDGGLVAAEQNFFKTLRTATAELRFRILKQVARAHLFIGAFLVT
jgi:RNase P/RNase MRP subunit p30